MTRSKCSAGLTRSTDPVSGRHGGLAAAITSEHVWSLRLAVKTLEGADLIEAPHHAVICRALDEVVAGRMPRLLINIPPGYSKTLSAVWSLIARGLVINPRARFLHTSYSADLALDNSAKVKQLVSSAGFQLARPIEFSDDTTAKGLWRTTEGGGMRAVQAGGGMTGFRAGQMAPGFTGAAIIDDPTKPGTATSRKQMADANRWYNDTFASRLAHEGVPIVVIMQRLATFAGDFTSETIAESGDLSEYLLRGGSGETWSHLMLPAEIDNAAPYPAEWTHGDPIAHGLPDGPLWPYKLDTPELRRIERANPYVWAAQYQQRPKARTGDSLIRGEWFRRYAELPALDRIELFADTASKKGESNDYTVLLAAGRGTDGNLYVLDVLRSKWTVPELHAVGLDFWSKWQARGAVSFSIEDANSGTFLIQSLQQTLRHTVKGIRRTRDKFSRVSAIIEPISSGRVLLPVSAPWVSAFVAECEDFSDDDSHAHDDQVDCLADACETLLMSSPYDLDALL